MEIYTSLNQGVKSFTLFFRTGVRILLNVMRVFISNRKETSEIPIEFQDFMFTNVTGAQITDVVVQTGDGRTFVTNVNMPVTPNGGDITISFDNVWTVGDRAALRHEDGKETWSHG